MADKQAVQQGTTGFTILPHQRVPIGMRARFAAEIMNAARHVPAGASRMRARRCFRLAMEKQKRRPMKLWRATIR